jgi:hypothetical protein
MSPKLLALLFLLFWCLPCPAWAQEICIPYEPEPCQLSNGCGGTRVCNRWGTGYGACKADSESTAGAACMGCGGLMGTRVCNELGTYTGCRVAELESCNNCDDDGDGFKDNDVGVFQDNSLMSTCNPNSCSVGGTKTCTNGSWSPCRGCSGAAPCTGCDNRSGTAICNESCGKSVCNVGPEACNNCDDNADGYKDNAPGIPQDNSLTMTCGPNACGQSGTQACTSGIPSACAYSEGCNNCDDDNDGVVDEGLSCQPCDL